MPICASGEISLGGSTVGRSVNIEIGAVGTATITMNQTVVRTLAGVTTPGSQISMNCFYGKSLAPTVLGSVYQGGYYTGVVNIGGGVCYYMLLSPNATGCAGGCQWAVCCYTTGTVSTVNGYSNTWGPLNNPTHPAGNFTATRSINGYSDWYLPAIDETVTMYNNKGSMPAGEGYGTGECHWSSTETYFNYVHGISFNSGVVSNLQNKRFGGIARALRRSPI